MADPPNEVEEDVEGEVTNAAAQMRAARAAAGMTLQDVADRTRVPLRHLIALEEGEYSALPGTTYCAGFARAFARVVGLDETALVAQLRRDIDMMGGIDHDPHAFEEALNPARIPPRWLAWAAALIALLLAGAYGIWRMQITTPPTDEQIAVQRARETKAQNAARAARPQSQTPLISNGPVVMTAADDVWLRVYESDGTRLFEGTLTRGESYTVPANARNPMILTGRPDALAVTVGGQAIPPLGSAERTISDVPVNAAALLARARQPVVSDVTSAVGGPPAQTALVQSPPARMPSSPAVGGPASGKPASGGSGTVGPAPGGNATAP